MRLVTYGLQLFGTYNESRTCRWCRGSMHLVEHQDDLFPGRKTKITCMPATLCGKEIKKRSGIAWKTWWTTRYTSVKYSILTLLTAGRCSVTSRMSKGYLAHTSSIAAGSLHTACLLGTQGRAGLGLGCTPLSHIQCCSRGDVQQCVDRGSMQMVF